MPINNFINGQTLAYGRTRNTLAFWNQALVNNDNQNTNSLSSLVAQRQMTKVTMCLEKVGNRVLKDMAKETAKYLGTQPDLAKDYVIVIIDDPKKGREARAYRREDLVADLKSPEKEKKLESLKQNPLLHLTSDKGLPAMPDNKPELTGLAGKIQNFLDRNEKILDLLSRQGVLKW